MRAVTAAHCLGALLLSASSSLSASPISFVFEGTVHCSLTELFSDSYVPCGGEFNDPVTVKGSYTYDSSDVRPLDVGPEGSWGFGATSSGPGYGIHWQFGSSLVADFSSVTITAEHTLIGGPQNPDEFRDSFRVGATGGRSPVIWIEQCNPNSLGNPGGPSLFDEPGFPNNFDLSRWTGGTCHLDSTPLYAAGGFGPEYPSYHFYWNRGTPISLYSESIASPSPEPETYAMWSLGVGLVLALTARRRREGLNGVV